MRHSVRVPWTRWTPAGITGSRLVRFLWMVVLTAPLAAFDFQQGTGITLEEFKTQGQSDDGAQWHLSGARADIRGGVYHLERVRVVLYTSEGKEFVIESPSCVYREERGVIESEDRVHVTGDGLILDGVGYDILVNERRLRIRRSVRMIVDRMEDLPSENEGDTRGHNQNRSNMKEGRGSATPEPMKEGKRNGEF